MNKKFSTLAIACMASTLFSSTQAATISQGTRDVTKIETNKFYQLGDATAGKVLVMVPDGNGYTLKLKDVTAVTDVNSTLWSIQYSYSNNATGPDFTFVNKGTGIPLMVNPGDAPLYDATKTYAAADGFVKMNGAASSWKWKSSTETQSSPFGTSGLISYFAKDSVVTLVTGATATPNATGNGYTSSEDVYLVKAHASRDKWEGRHLRLAPITAGAVTLSAKDLNTKLATDPEGDSFKLGSTPELKKGVNSTLGNQFTDNTFRAWDIQAAATDEDNFKMYVENGNFNVSEGGLLLQVIDDANDADPYKDTYLLADTFYIDGLSVNNQDFVKFGTDKMVTDTWQGNKYIKNVQPGRLAASSKFKFTYYPTQDSIAIEVLGYNKKNGSTGATATTVNGKATLWDQSQSDKTVILNKLTASNEITLGISPANVRFFLGEGTTNRTSENNGVYVIKNDKDQYLAVPIYNTKKDNGVNAWTNAPKWVTVKASEQEVMNMPAYQWVILKDHEETSEIAELSTVTLINREFAGVKQSIQLRQEEGGAYKFVAGGLHNIDSLDIKPVTAAALGNEKLGYLNLDNKVLDVMSYKFNYLHSYADDKFIGMNGDSILYVKDAELSFFMNKETAEVPYGITVDNALKAKISGLKQLKRVMYTPYVKTSKGNLYITLDSEGRYKMTSDEAKAKKFYLKENNFYKAESVEAARPYYAFINVAATDSTKIGSADEDLSVILKDNVLEETRTSAFAIVENNAPLYRRFNTALDGAVEGQEDAAKLLKFKEYYRGEYLMDENNEKFKNEGVCYLGIEREDKVNPKAGLSFVVDTATIDNAPNGKIKPQYFIYVSQSEKIAEPAKPCELDHEHLNGITEWTCPHAIPAKPGFTRAKYLVSFADSLKAKDADKLYQFGDYTRVGFVDAMHIGDSLYVLTNGFEELANADLDTAKIKAAYKAAKIDADYIIDLKSELKKDAHKNYTWSFRYINPDKAAAATVENLDVAFLIESDKEASDLDVAPINGAWLKSQNGCLVLSDSKSSTFENARTGGDNALVFNIEIGSEDDMATDNETIATSTVSVVATNGAVIVKGAEGKKVVISNVLGQTIANTVITSNEATISAPAGYVTVAVEGEAAVKAIVK